jgi:hypothetical protein
LSRNIHGCKMCEVVKLVAWETGKFGRDTLWLTQFQVQF